jgi:hypothetical protein
MRLVGGGCGIVADTDRVLARGFIASIFMGTRPF